MRLMYMEELKILFGDFVTLTLALHVPSGRSWPMSYNLAGAWDQNYSFGLYIVFLTIHTQMFPVWTLSEGAH